MERVLKFSVPEGHYQADATIVWCFDDRFSRKGQDLLDALIGIRKFNFVDTVKVAGGAKDLTTTGPGQDFILGQILASIKLHRSPEVILMVHADCGAYGKTFATEDEMRAFFTGQLELAEKTVSDKLEEKGVSDITITKYLADFEGILQL